MVRRTSYDVNGERVMLCNNPNVYETKLDELISIKHFSQTAIEILAFNVKLLQELTVYMRIYLEKEDDKTAFRKAQKELNGILEKKCLKSGSLKWKNSRGNYGNIRKALICWKRKMPSFPKSKVKTQLEIGKLQSEVMELHRFIDSIPDDF